MISKKNTKKSRIGAVVLTIILLGTGFLGAVSSLPLKQNQITASEQPSSTDDGVYVLDRSYAIPNPNPASTGRSDNDDAGYKRDAGNDIAHSVALYPGEVIDDTPGRGRTGKLNTTTADQNDWYFFGVCQGQSIGITLTPSSGSNIDIFLKDASETLLASSTNPGSNPESITYIARFTGKYYLQLQRISGTGVATYSFTVVITGQNDSGTHADAGNTLGTAVLITPGLYYGYVDMNDAYDYYKFQVTAGQGIHLKLSMKDFAYLSDFDLNLYNPSGKLVYQGKAYFDDEFNYPADVSGQWRARVDIFPGWVDIPHPTNWQYFTYGAGPYSLQLTLETSAPAPPGPVPQPDITPIAKTYIVPNDPTSSKDEFGYLAAVPAANYLSGGNRYLAALIYSGDFTSTNYYNNDKDRGTVDNTTNYLIADWNAYLATYGKTPVQYTVPSDPIQAAADIATHNWVSSSLAVVAVDGSGYTDEVSTVLSKTKTLKREVSVIDVPGDSSKILNLGGYGYPMFLGPKWCALNVSMFGTGGAQPSVSSIIPHFMPKATEWWPYPNDEPDGPKIDIYTPITRMGIWTAGTDKVSASLSLEITKYAGDRYHVKVKNSDSVLRVNLTTTEASDLLVFLVDPNGYLRDPVIPAWCGQYVNPLGVWNGCSFDPSAGGYEPWRRWVIQPHTQFSAQALHPEAGLWTIIVVPRNAVGPDVKYTLKAEIQTTNSKRADAEMSAANAAVIASLNHAPLLYVKEDSIPSQTASAFTTLGVNKVIFVERGEIGSAVRGSLPTIQNDLKTMQDIVDLIKANSASENYITVTSLKTEGSFAPAAMLAAYHGSPVIRIEDVPGDPAAVAQRMETWLRWDGDYYHGERSTGHLPMATAPINMSKLQIFLSMVKFLLKGEGDLPPFGLDAKRYWTEDMYTSFHNYIVSLGLDKEGQEGYAIVAPREDITLVLSSALMGNNSYSGQIPGITPAYSADVIARNLLYPALIFANPNRNITTSEMMNFPDGGTWKTNDGKTTPVFSSRIMKEDFSAHFRTYIGHCLWDAHLDQINTGASLMYYSGHGTGGSGISAQYKQTQFCHYPTQVWSDGWRGYMYDNWKTPRDGGFTWYNPEPSLGNLYEIVHYDYVDAYMKNLHSMAILYMSCTTGDGDCPLVYLDHGAVCWYGNAGTGLCPEADLQDDEFFHDTLVDGMAIGPAYSKQVWLHFRDFTTSDPTSMYGPSSMQVETIQVIYGDPNLIIYSPDWQSPIPVNG